MCSASCYQLASESLVKIIASEPCSEPPDYYGTEVDMAVFAAYYQSYARWKEAQEHITSGGSTFETDKGYQQQTPRVGIANTNQKLMLQAAAEFGLTPSSRSRIIAGNSKAKEPEDEMEVLLGVVVNGKGNKI